MADYQASTAPSTTAAPLPADYPGKTLGIVGLVLAIVAPVIGIIISAVALNQSKTAGYPNKLAKIGIIVGIVLAVVGIIASIAYFAFVASTIGTAGY